MTSYICCVCEEPITEDTIQKRHYSTAKPMPSVDHLVCSKACENKRRYNIGLYSRMSEQGRDARSKAVTQSNRDNPRRKKH